MCCDEKEEEKKWMVGLMAYIHGLSLAYVMEGQERGKAAVVSTP